MITTADFSKGIVVKIDGNYWEIAEYQFVNPWKGSAFTAPNCAILKTSTQWIHTLLSGFFSRYVK